MDISSKARRRASQFTSAAAARGLLASKNNPFDSLGAADEKALHALERLYIKPGVGYQFLKEKE